MKKKILAFILAAAMLLSLSACAKDTPQNPALRRRRITRPQRRRILRNRLRSPSGILTVKVRKKSLRRAF